MFHQAFTKVSFYGKKAIKLALFGFKKTPPLLFAFLLFISLYSRHKLAVIFTFFEKNKDILVKFFMMKRGRYNRPFLHITAMLVMGLGVLIAPFLADSFPIFSKKTDAVSNIGELGAQQSITIDNNVFQTDISNKPRDKVIDYTVEKGDTVSTIARKFGISEDTVRWENDLSSDDITVGDTLKILPVTGIATKVTKGDTVFTLAKKYDTNAQKIVDFPFNDFANPETFSLVEGQILIIPDGIKPEEQPFVHQQVYIAQGPISISSAGLTWPVHGEVSQFASWYHMALDIAAPYGSPMVAAQSGVVSSVSVGTYDGGYGTSIYIDGGNGITTHYAHMKAVNVSVGDHVTAGSTLIGWIGLTGRTTGPHVHFEVRKNGTLVDPLPYLQ